MKQQNTRIILLSLISFTTLGLATACNSSANNGLDSSTNNEIKSELNSESRKFIEEYNSLILEFQNADNETQTAQKLKSLIPKLKQINSDKERNRILISSYLRVGETEQAYKLTEEILAKEKKPNMKNFQCMLMESLRKPASLIKGCYSEAAILYKNELNKLDPSAFTYTQMLWGFNVNMYHAGNNEYIDHLKKIVNDQTEENDKFMYEQLFELETNIDERQELLHTIASRI